MNEVEAGMRSAAQVIDFEAYRRQRATPAARDSAIGWPVMLVPVWMYVPVVVVGYH